MISISDYPELQRVLREYRTWPPSADDPTFDVVGIGQLLVACLENLREHHVEADLAALATLLTDEQRAFLIRVATAKPHED